MSIDHSTGRPISKKYTVNQGCMSLSTYLLEYGRHVARLRRRRRRRRRAYAPTSNTASHDNHKKILHGFPFLSRDDYGAPLGGPSGRRSSAKIRKFLKSTLRRGPLIDQFRYIKIQPKTIDLTRLMGINTEFLGFIPKSLVLRSIVLG